MDEPNEPQTAIPKAALDEGEPTGVTVIDDVRITKTFLLHARTKCDPSRRRRLRTRR
jgi:hypothetical protein